MHKTMLSAAIAAATLGFGATAKAEQIHWPWQQHHQQRPVQRHVPTVKRAIPPDAMATTRTMEPSSTDSYSSTSEPYQSSAQYSPTPGASQFYPPPQADSYPSTRSSAPEPFPAIKVSPPTLTSSRTYSASSTKPTQEIIPQAPPSRGVRRPGHDSSGGSSCRRTASRHRRDRSAAVGQRCSLHRSAGIRGQLPRLGRPAGARSATGPAAGDCAGAVVAAAAAPQLAPPPARNRRRNSPPSPPWRAASRRRPLHERAEGQRRRRHRQGLRRGDRRDPEEPRQRLLLPRQRQVRQEGLRWRDRRLWPGDQALSDRSRLSQQPRRRLRGQERSRPRARRLQRGDQGRPQGRRTATTAAAPPISARATSPAPPPITAR